MALMSGMMRSQRSWAMSLKFYVIFDPTDIP